MIISTLRYEIKENYYELLMKKFLRSLTVGIKLVRLSMPGFSAGKIL